MEVVSVIIPAYNCEKFIMGCVQSVVDNSSDKFKIELIVIDDGSTDNTSEILDQLGTEFHYAANGVMRVKHQKNAGPGCARNAGLEIASGNYIMFLDADDKLAKDTLNKMVCRIKKDRTSIVIGKTMYQIGFIKFGESYECWDENPIGVVDLKIRALILKITPGIRGKLFKRDLIIGARFANTKWEDLGIIPALLAKARNVSFLDEVVYIYRVHMNTTVNDFIHKTKVQDVILALDNLKQNLQAYGVYDDFQYEYRSMLVLHTLFRAENVETWLDAKKAEKVSIIRSLLDSLSTRYPNWMDDPVLCDEICRYKDPFFNFLLKRLKKYV